MTLVTYLGAGGFFLAPVNQDAGNATAHALHNRVSPFYATQEAAYADRCPGCTVRARQSDAKHCALCSWVAEAL